MAANRVAATGVLEASTKIRAIASKCRATRNAAGSPSARGVIETKRAAPHAKTDLPRQSREAAKAGRSVHGARRVIAPSSRARIALAGTVHSDLKVTARKAAAHSSRREFGPAEIARFDPTVTDRRVIVHSARKGIARAVIVQRAEAADSSRVAGRAVATSAVAGEADAAVGVEAAGPDDPARRALPATPRS